MTRRWIAFVAAALLAAGALVLALVLVQNGSRPTVTPRPRASLGSRVGALSGTLARASGDRQPIGGGGAPDGVIGGAISDERDQPIERALVCAAPVGRQSAGQASCVEARGGRFTLTGLAPGHYAVWGDAADHAPASYRGPRRRRVPNGNLAAVALGAAERLDDIDLVLSRGAVELAGRVRDRGGPIVAARVRQLAIGATYDPIGDVVTDAAGRFALRVQPGVTALEVAAEGYLGRVLQVAAPTAPIEVLLAPAGAITGRVVDQATGAAMAGLRVEASSIGPRIFDQRASSEVATSGDDGRFELPGLRPGRYVLRAEGWGWLGGGGPVPVTVDEPVDVEVRVRRAAAVAGTVAVGRADCIAGEVELEPVRAGHEAERAGGIIGAGGGFELAAVEPGAYRLTARCEGAAPAAPVDLELRAGERRAIRLEVDPGLTLRGRVERADGAPAAEVVVVASAATGDRRARSAADGGFTISGLAPGRYRVLAMTATGEETGAAVEAVAPSTAPVRLVLSPSGAARVVLVDRDGRLVAHGQVVLEGEGGIRDARFDGLGFGADHLPLGRYGVRAYGPRRELLAARGPAALTVAVGELASITVVVDRPASVLRGRVVDAGGGAVADAWVSASMADREGDLDPATAVTTDEDGEFEIPGVVDRPYRVAAVDGRGGQGAVEAARPGEVTVVQLSREAPGHLSAAEESRR